MRQNEHNPRHVRSRPPRQKPKTTQKTHTHTHTFQAMYTRVHVFASVPNLPQNVIPRKAMFTPDTMRTTAAPFTPRTTTPNHPTNQSRCSNKTRQHTASQQLTVTTTPGGAGAHAPGARLASDRVRQVQRRRPRVQEGAARRQRPLARRCQELIRVRRPEGPERGDGDRQATASGTVRLFCFPIFRG